VDLQSDDGEQKKSRDTQALRNSLHMEEIRQKDPFFTAATRANGICQSTGDLIRLAGADSWKHDKS